MEKFKLGGQVGPWISASPVSQILEFEVNIDDFKREFNTPELRWYYYNYLAFLKVSLKERHAFMSLTSDCPECYDRGVIPNWDFKSDKSWCSCEAARLIRELPFDKEP